MLKYKILLNIIIFIDFVTIFILFYINDIAQNIPKEYAVLLGMLVGLIAYGSLVSATFLLKKINTTKD